MTREPRAVRDIALTGDRASGDSASRIFAAMTRPGARRAGIGSSEWRNTLDAGWPAALHP